MAAAVMGIFGLVGVFGLAAGELTVPFLAPAIGAFVAFLTVSRSRRTCCLLNRRPGRQEETKAML